jgi:tellurite resistance protein TerA
MAKLKPKKVAWDLKNEQVMIIAAGKLEALIEKELIFVTYNKRFYRPSKYLATYANGKVNSLYEITETPQDNCNLENMPELAKFVDSKEYQITATTAARVFKLKKLKNLKIENNSVSKTGKNIPFTYGNTRYSTLEKIEKAKLTSELIAGIAQEEVVLTEAGESTCIQPNGAKVVLEWSSTDDFDLALAYQDTTGDKGLIYFQNKGNLNSFPYMQITQDEGTGIKAGVFKMFGIKSKKQEQISIANMDKIKTAYLICWDWKKGDHDKASFDKSDAKISIVDSEDFVSTSKLQSQGGFNAVCIAKIEQNQDEFVLTNMSKGFVKTIDVPILFQRLAESIN